MKIQHCLCDLTNNCNLTNLTNELTYQQYILQAIKVKSFCCGFPLFLFRSFSSVLGFSVIALMFFFGNCLDDVL